MVQSADKRWRNALLVLPLLVVLVAVPIVAMPPQSHSVLKSGTFLAGKCYIDSCTMNGTLLGKTLH